MLYSSLYFTFVLLRLRSFARLRDVGIGAFVGKRERKQGKHNEIHTNPHHRVLPETDPNRREKKVIFLSIDSIGSLEITRIQLRIYNQDKWNKEILETVKPSPQSPKM